MDQLFKLQNEKTWKTLLLTGNNLMLVNKSYDSTEEFLEKFSEKGFLKERLEILIPGITKMVHPEKESNTVTITYPKNNKTSELPLVFESAAELEQFAKAISKQRNMTAAPQQVSVLKAIGSPLLGLGLNALFAFIVYEDAQVIEAGGEIDTSGRRSLYKKLFAWLAESLGTQGTIIAAVVIGLLCAWFIYKNLQARPVEVVYS